MNVVELIERKRDGGELSPDEIRSLIREYSARRVPDYQMSAMAMAIYLQGLCGEELRVWTEAMLHSGEVLDLSTHPLPKVDKHSTGGVGDKVTIPLAPMVAACGVAVPMISGRGLGHTGGTLDKLEAIPGFTSALDPTRFREVLDATNLAIAGASKTLVPADRRLYALRDVTATVASIPLISSSIMSKKLAEDLDGLVLDVKFGHGASITDFEDAKRLAKTMIGIGASHHTPVTAFLTDMNQPLGKEVGNASEIRESIAVLLGEGPDDVTELTYALGAEMLVLAGVEGDEADARRRLDATVASGEALELFGRVIAAQGGDPRVLEDPSLLPIADHVHEVRAPASGVLSLAHARRIGVAATRLGAGRATKDEIIDPAVGITVHARVGDEIAAGDLLAEVHWNDASRLADCLIPLETAWEFADSAEPLPLIREVLR